MNAIAPAAPRVRITSSVSVAGEQLAADVLLVGVRAQQPQVLVGELDQPGEPGDLHHVGPGRLAVLEEGRADVRVVADEHVGLDGPPDQVDDRGAARLQGRAERADVDAEQVLGQVLGGQVPHQVEVVRRGVLRVEVRRRGARRTPGDHRALRERHAAGPEVLGAQLAEASSPSRVTSVVGTSSRARPTATLRQEPPTASWRGLPSEGTHDVDQGLADHQERCVIAQCPKSTAAYALSFCSLCSEVIDRIVPLRERITSEWVLAPPAR